MDKKKIALIVVVLFLLIGLGSFVFANPDQDNNLEGPGVSEDGGSGDGEAIDGTTPTATPTEEGNGQTTLGINPVTTIGNGGTGTGTNGSDSTEVTGGIGNTEMSAYEDAAKIVAELENKVASMTNRDESNAAIDYRTDTDIMNIVNGLPDGEEKDQLLDRLATINKVLDDTKKPVISGIDNGDVTKENVTINVTDDNDVVITATLDGEAIDFTTPLTEEGKYVVIVTDKNFNSSTVEFTIDKHAPEITAKEESVGSFEKNVFSNVSFKLHDNVGVSAYKINNGEYIPVTVSPWSDANYDNIKNQLVYGTNTITLKDVAGNEATYEFVYDNQNPTITVKEGYEGSLEKKVFSNVSFKLTDEYEVVAYKINNGEYKEFTVSKVSDANFANIDNQLVYGTNTITLKDVAGNEATYEFTYDNIAPVVLENNSTGSNDLFSLVNLKLYDANGIVSLVINEVQYPHTGIYIDINDGYIYTFPEGENTIEFTDIAGNKTVYTFTVDKTAPTVKFPSTHNSNANYKNWDTLAVTISDIKLSEVYYAWANTDKYVNATTLVPSENVIDNGNGTYTVNVPTVDGRNRLSIKAIDAAGNVTKVYSTSGAYNIDTTAPVFDLSEIPTTFTIGEDIYKYPQPGKVTDNIDGTISFSKVHMNWYHKNTDGTKGEATQCFGGNNWNTSLTNCEPGDYIITYRVSDNAGNIASEEKMITLVEKKENQAPVVNVIYNYGTSEEYSEPIESGKTYKGVVLSFADDSGSFTLYYDQDNGYTNKVTLVQNTVAQKITNATLDNPYKWNRGASKGLSIYIADNEGKSLFIKNVIIEK